MQLNKPAVEIILPPNLAEASASALKLCELFLEGLLKSESKVITLSVDLPNKAIQCNDPAVREIVRLFVGSGQFSEFVRQQISLLHKTEIPGSIGELRFLCEGRSHVFIFEGAIERGGWKIVAD